MPSSDNNFYKSRLFRFINRQYIKLNNQFEKTVRQFKVAASWGIQILLYPIYILVQTGRLGGKQLEEKILHKQKKPQEKLSLAKKRQLIPKSDKPIQQVLKTVKPWLSPLSLPEENLDIVSSNLSDSLSTSENFQLQQKQNQKQNQKQIIEVITTNNNSQLSDSNIDSQLKSPDQIIIQGVASLLEKKSLVLVSNENQIFDILTEKQQQKLAHRINLEIAYYSRNQVAIKPSKNPWKSKKGLSKIAINNPYLLTPIRMFWEVMSWMETGKVAISLDIFGESNLVKIQSPSGSNLPEIQQEKLSIVLASIDNTMATLETKPLVYANNLKYQMGDQIGNLRQQFKTSYRSSLPSNPYKIQTLIWAAIDYFLVQSQQELSSKKNTIITSNSSQNQTSLPLSLSSLSTPLLPEVKEVKLEVKPQVKPDIEKENWLSWKDLFGKSKANNSEANNSENSILIPSDLSLSPSSNSSSNPSSNQTISSELKQLNLPPNSPKIARNSLGESIKRNLSKLNFKKQQKSLSQQQKPSQSQKLAEFENNTQNYPQNHSQNIDETIQISNLTTLVSSESQLDSNQNQIEEKDYLETNATSSGYVKHPLERILGWLDKIILWIEELIVKIWRWLKRK